MAEPVLDPSAFITEIPDDQIPSGGPVTLDSLASRQHTLPVSAVPLGDEDEPPDEGALTPAEQAALREAQIPPGTTVAPVTAPPDIPGGVPVSLPPEVAAMQQRLALLEAELTGYRSGRGTTAPAPTTSSVPPGPTSDEIVERVAARMLPALDHIENMDAGSETYHQERARAFARAIHEAVAEDIMTSEGVQQRFRSEAERVADARVQVALSQENARREQSLAAQTVFDEATTIARAAGYNVHPPTAPEHASSPESVAFWALANAFSQPNRSIAEEARAALAMMPPKAPVTPAPPATPRPQPMGRATSVSMPQVQADEEYTPMSLNQIIDAGLQRQRIG